MRLPRWDTDRLLGWSKLLACAALAAVVWLAALPLLGSRPAIERSIRQNELRGIDPSAKFYTELPGMPDFFERTDAARRRHREAFGLSLTSE